MNSKRNKIRQFLDFLIEDNEVGFRVYRGYFENAPKMINEMELKLELIEKNDYHFALGYRIVR